MKCPIDGVDLMMSERHGIEIDYCPQCRGVWLDRGELDKIIEKSAPDRGAPPPQKVEQPRGSDERGYRDERDYGRPQKKRKSFLDDIFDF